MPSKDCGVVVRMVVSKGGNAPYRGAWPRALQPEARRRAVALTLTPTHLERAPVDEGGRHLGAPHLARPRHVHDMEQLLHLRLCGQAQGRHGESVVSSASGGTVHPRHHAKQLLLLLTELERERDRRAGEGQEGWREARRAVQRRED